MQTVRFLHASSCIDSGSDASERCVTAGTRSYLCDAGSRVSAGSRCTASLTARCSSDNRAEVAQVSDRLPDMRMPLLGPQSEQRTRINAPPSHQGYLLPWQEMVDGWL